MQKSNKKITLLMFLSICCTLTKAQLEERQIYGDIFSESLSLSLTSLQQTKQVNEHKCVREVPAIFFQTYKNEIIRGNGSTIYHHRLEICCDGWVRSPYNWHTCIPDCSVVSLDNCRNGFCRSPNQCECFDEFVRNDRGICVHTCPIACEHGRCFLNGTCACNVGYELDPQTRKFCRPICTQACGTHQRCDAPGKCSCIDGYRMTDDLGCQPVCTPDCGYGKCVGPNQCECFAGYMKRPHRNVCEAECYINCENGFCESRHKCQCRDGYKYDLNTTSCLPDCGDSCENGVCIAPGVCKCFAGYQLNESTCEPVCEGGCGYYGKCVEPGICGCGEENRHCRYGSCDALGRCICLTGLTRYIDKCTDPRKLETIVGSSYQQRERYNWLLKHEFNALIGRFFQFWKTS